MSYQGEKDMVPAFETFKELVVQADAAGRAAVAKLKVVPMIVGEAKGLFSNEIDYTKPVEYVSDGVCGFAWIYIYPEHKGNTKLGKQERKTLEDFGFEKDDCNPQKYILWVHDFNQSLQKKTAYANAFADVLYAHGIRAGGQSRID
jgi:hypothetical protein